MVKFYFQQSGNILEVRLASDQSINAWQGRVLLPEELKVEKIVTAGGISEIWQTVPRRDETGIVFIGGKPNGFSGDGLLFKFAAGRGEYILRFNDQTEAYLNDGSGTAAGKELATLAVEPVALVGGDNDTIRPLVFRPEILREGQFFGGRPVAIFKTEDLESGINRYEVKEYTRNGRNDWHLAESPYLINEDVYKLEIKAVDNAGNERVESLRIGANLEFAVAAIIIAVIIIGAIVYNIKKR